MQYRPGLYCLREVTLLKLARARPAVADPNQDGSAGEQIVKECRSMAELLRDKPHCLLQFLQDRGVMCLGAFKVEVRLPW